MGEPTEGARRIVTFDRLRPNAIVLTSLAGLGVVTALVELDAGSGSLRVGADVVAGLAIASAGLLDTRQPRAWLLVLAGSAWLIAGVVPGLANVHRGLLLAAFATPALLGRIRAVLVVGTAVVLCLPGVGALAGAALFAGAAVVARNGRAALAACAAVQLALALAFDRGAGVLAVPLYGLALAGVCLATVLTGRDRRRALPDATATTAGEPDVFGALSAVVAQVTGDASLTIEAYRAPSNADGRPPDRSTDVDVDGQPWATLRASDATFADAETMNALRRAISAVGRHERLRVLAEARTRQLADTRVRLLDAADKARGALGPTLASTVVLPLREAAAIADVRRAAAELAGAADDVDRLVAGLAPQALGNGALNTALASLARQAPVQVTVHGRASGSPTTEATAYAVCAEGVSNALKHAIGCGVLITVWSDHETLTVTVSDDGPGGADPGAAGLRGLRDRVEGRRGDLRVVSQPGCGTTITASLPAWSTAEHPAADGRIGDHFTRT